MRMTAEEFIGLMSRQGIQCRLRRGQIALTGENEELLSKLRGVLKGNPNLEHGVKKHLQEATRMMADKCVLPPLLETEKTPKEKASASIEPVPSYHMKAGESVKEYLRRNHADLFLKSILEAGITEGREILEATRKGYQDMWDGASFYRGGKYHNDPVVKRQRERIVAVLDGAFRD